MLVCLLGWVINTFYLFNIAVGSCWPGKLPGRCLWNIIYSWCRAKPVSLRCAALTFVRYPLHLPSYPSVKFCFLIVFYFIFLYQLNSTFKTSISINIISVISINISAISINMIPIISIKSGKSQEMDIHFEIEVRISLRMKYGGQDVLHYFA